MAGPSGVTPRLALPYPIPDDNVDVPRDVKALADKLDVLPGIPQPAFVTALPGSPVDGQECYYHAAPTYANGAVWHLRYRAARTQYKWECLGGQPLVAFEVSSIGPSGDGVWFGGAPALTMPLAGEYEIAHGCDAMGDGTFACLYYAQPRLAGVQYNPGNAQVGFGPQGGTVTGMLVKTCTATLVAANTLVDMVYMNGGNGGGFARRYLSCTPIAVG